MTAYSRNMQGWVEHTTLVYQTTRSALFGFASPIDDSPACRYAPAIDIDFGSSNRIVHPCRAPCIDGDDHRLRSKTGADLPDQFGPGDRGTVDADLVGASVKDRGRIFG